MGMYREFKHALELDLFQHDQCRKRCDYVPRTDNPYETREARNKSVQEECTRFLIYRLTLTTLAWRWIDCSRVRTKTIFVRPVKPVLTKSKFHVWATSAPTVIFSEDTTYAVLFSCTNYWKFIETVKSLFEKILMFILGTIWRVHVFGDRMFLFSKHRPMVNKFSDTEYKHNPFKR
jgi:hypothetical protein